ncbi:MAG: VTT domain-containing protein [Patescibacteria group bacterium]
MIETAIYFIETTLVPLGALGVFIATILEEVIAPIPSAVVTLTAGFFFLKDGFSPEFFQTLFFTIALPSATGVALGSLFVYGIAYMSGKIALEKWGKWLGVSWSDIEKMQQKFSRTSTDDITLFFLRTLPLVPSVAVSALCGLIRMNVLRYLTISFFGSIVRASVIALIGSQVGALYYEYAAQFEKFEKFVLVGFLFLMILSVWFLRRRKAFAGAEYVKIRR